MRVVQNLDQAAWNICAHVHVPSGASIPIESASDWSWEPVSIPTDVLTHLTRIGRIADPRIGTNDLECRWVEELDWVFRAQFEADPGLLATDFGTVLVLDQIDCWGEVFLNRTHVGSVENFFREHRLTVDEKLIAGQNELIIYLRSAKIVNEALERVHGVLPSGFDTPRVHARRVQCWTGWDWAARLSSAGVLGVPSLETVEPFSLESPFAYVRELAPVQPGAERADFAVVVGQVDIVTRRKGKGQLTGEILDPEGRVVARAQVPVNLGLGRAKSRLSFRLKDAPLWWPSAMGPRHFHTIRFLLSGEDRFSVTFSAESSVNFGVRTVLIRKQKDAAGESFIPVVNGNPVFARGANWIPVSMLPGEIRDGDYLRLLGLAASTGMNCIRVWGGGMYEKSVFYETCDRLGLLVWQDFMFACAAYPVYREFLDEVELEGDYQVRRLRNHPCLLLWCGNNENEWLHQLGVLRLAEERRIIGETIWSSLLADTVTEQDPSRPYHQSSPFGRDRGDYNDQGSGDRHHWDVWAHWRTGDCYLSDRGRFLSEFGMQGFPDAECIRGFAGDADSLFAPVLVHHQKMIQGQERIMRYVSEMLPVPDTFAGWIGASRAMQAEVLRRAVEHWRRRKFDTAGALIWMLNDAYPALSWSLLDHRAVPKPAFEAARRFFAPTLLSVFLQAGGQEVGAFQPVEAVASAPPADHPVSGGTDDAAPQPPADSRRVGIMWINDTPHALSGTLFVEGLASDGTPLGRIERPFAAPPNLRSERVELSLADLGIRDIRRDRVRACIAPDDPTSLALENIRESIRSALARVLGENGNLPPVDFSPALTAETNLVERRELV